jgi:hypothetical protein
MEDIITVDEEVQERENFAKKNKQGVKVAKKLRFKVCRKLALLFCREKKVDVVTKRKFENLATKVEEFFSKRASSLREYQELFLKFVKILGRGSNLSRELEEKVRRSKEL